MSSETLTYLTKTSMYGEVQSEPSKVSRFISTLQICHFIASSFWDSTCSILSVPAVNAIRGSGTVRTLQIDLQKLLHTSEAKYDTFDGPSCSKS